MMKNNKCFHQVYRKSIIFAGLLILMAGIYCYKQMQTNLFPEVLFPRITVIADAGQQPIDRMMITVTKPLESAVKKVPGVTIVKSYTGRGSSDIDVYFKWGTDIYALKTQLESRINEIKGFSASGHNHLHRGDEPVALPRLRIHVGKQDAQQNRVARCGRTRSAPRLFARQRREQCRGSWRQSQGICRRPRCRQDDRDGHYAPLKIKEALNGTKLRAGKTATCRHTTVSICRSPTPVSTPSTNFSNTMVRNDGIRKVRLCDVARVEVKEQQEFLKINADGHDAVLIDLVKQPGVNLLDFAKDVEAKAKEAKALLPAGYELKPYYNQSAFVGDSIHSVIKTIYEGLFLAIVVMILFFAYMACQSRGHPHHPRHAGIECTVCLPGGHHHQHHVARSDGGIGGTDYR
jgi:multidrug efflux pump subunit AcrB